MLTDFGRELRKLRVDRGLRLLDLAEKTGVSVPMLSAVETGRRAVPDGFIAKLARALALNQGQVRSLENALAVQNDSVEIPLSMNRHDRSRDLAFAFARNFGNFDQKAIDELLKSIENKAKK